MVSQKVIYEHIGSVGVKIEGHGKYFFSYPDCNLILEDITYFLMRGNEHKLNQNEKNRYARVAIIYMAFYIESLSNWLEFELINSNNKPKKMITKKTKRDKDEYWPTPLYKLRIAYVVLENNNHLPKELDIRGIRDLFRIRNGIFAHPPGRSITGGNILKDGKGIPEDKKPVYYEKFEGILPKIQSEFTIEHAKIMYNEIKIFLKEYYGVISKHFSKDFLSSYCSLKELE